jgi:Zn-dependent membrane protease YugP
MHLLILIVALVAAIFGPQMWARHVLARYSTPEDHFDGSGAELARHLLDRFGMQQVKVEHTELGDHYDPQAKAVRLGAGHFDGRSLTAITVAAHEVGHAMQDHQGYRPLRARTRMVGAVRTAEKLGAAAMLAIPVVGLLTRSPAAGGVMFLAGLASLGMAAVVHLITLPVEWDASFGKALPVLKQGRYLSARELRHARRILKACALTYVASSLAGMLNLARWIAVLRR